MDNHKAVHLELECTLSRRNPRRAATQAPTRINTHGRGLEGLLESQDVLQESARSLGFSQTAFPWALQGLDDNQTPVTFDHLLDLTVEHESAINPDSPGHLALNLDDCLDAQAAVGGNAHQHDDELM